MTKVGTDASPVVVVGAAIAGLRACEGLRRRGFDGSITLIGAENRLPYDRPPLSKGFLAGDEEEERLVLASGDELSSLEVELVLGERAVGLDLAGRTVRLGSGDEVAFGRLVIATGATPRRIEALAHLEGVVTLRTLEDSADLRRRLGPPGAHLVVVGGGFLGMEVAATARHLGAEVTVVEPLPTPLARVVGPLVGDAICSLHRDNGVDVRTGIGVDALVGSARVEGVRLSDGSVVPADVVLVAVGVHPETAWLEGSGLSLDDGVVCDASLRAAPGVVAAGDLARFPHPLAAGTVRFEHRTSAAEQGDHVASSLLDEEHAVPFDAVPYFWSDQFDVKIQSIGAPQPTDEVRVVEGSLKERRFVACYGRQGRLAGVLGFSMPRQLMRFRPLLTRGASFAEALAVKAG